MLARQINFPFLAPTPTLEIGNW